MSNLSLQPSKEGKGDGKDGGDKDVKMETEEDAKKPKAKGSKGVKDFTALVR